MIENRTVLPNQVLGILGGGQLGRMFTHEAQKLGFSVVVLDPTKDCPAAQVTTTHIQAAYDDESALVRLAQMSQAVTTEFENVPAKSLKIIAQTCQVSPASSVVAVAQDRIAEKSFIEAMGVPVAPHAPIHDEGELRDALKARPDLLPGILKLARNGYDGNGQARVKTLEEALAAFNQFDQEPCVLEKMMPLAKEVSVLVVRNARGEMVTYPMVENVHVNGILATTYVNPEAMYTDLQGQAVSAVERIASGLDYVGVLCVEFFVLEDGSLIANEMAPRPHNSAHYTQDACATSQFEQQVRAMTNLPLGSSQLLCPCIMLNILGDSWVEGEPDWASILALPGVKLHLYGKAHARAGRKMGHVNIVGHDFEQVRQIAKQVAQILHLAHMP